MPLPSTRSRKLGTITFARGDAFTIVGDLTLRGVTQEVTLTGEFGEAKESNEITHGVEPTNYGVRAISLPILVARHISVRAK
jgi:polyisoprenoid-binding protein YceI